MIIITQKLKNYRGFRLRQIKNFVYRPTKKTQLVLGSNGSGKSSLIKELSVLPADANDFERNGSKEIEVIHLGKHYLLQSLFDENGSRFPFICDGENLNPGYTVTIYKELCKAHFGYTTDVHNLITGNTPFHGMSVNDRRNWFTRLSEVDYTYAIDYHKRLKENIRNLQGALKRNQDRLVKETEKCLTAKDEEVLRQTVTELNQRLDILLAHRIPRQANITEQLQDSLKKTEETLSSAIMRLERLVSETEATGPIPDINTIEAQHSRLTIRVETLQAELVRRCEFLESLQKEISAATVNSDTSLETVQKTIKDLEESYTEVYRHLKFTFSFNNPASALSAIELVAEPLNITCQELSNLPRLDYTREDYQTLLKTNIALDQEIKKAKANEIAMFNRIMELESLRNKEKVNCPNCKHSWHVGFEENIYIQIKKQRSVLLIQIEELEKKYKESTAKSVEHEIFFERLNYFSDLTYRYPDLNSLWSYLKFHDILLKTPAMLSSIISNTRTDIQYHVRLDKIKTEIEENKKLEQLMLNASKIDVEKLKLRAQQENEAILNLQRDLRAVQDQHRMIKAFLSTYNSMQTLRGTIETECRHRTETYEALIKDRCQATLDEMIRNLKILVSQHERTLSQVDIQKGVVQSLGLEIKMIDQELVLLKQAQAALSPSEGLIARGMVAFINHFVQQMNNFIEKIWLYPLTIMPLEVSEDEELDLNYKFKVLVNNDLPTPDIAQTSKGMREVIDLAFVVVSMRYLGLSNFPIFLDEFAASFDVAHRQAAYKAIDLLIDSTDYSQVFLVSHYQAGYSSLTSSEVLVLCDSNIELPSHLAYNQHVTLE